MRFAEGQTITVQLEGEEPRAMRVARMCRSGPGTVDLTLEVVGGPDEIVCTCPYLHGPDGVRMGTSRTCEMHGENRGAARAKLERIVTARAESR